MSNHSNPAALTVCPVCSATTTERTATGYYTATYLSCPVCGWASDDHTPAESISVNFASALVNNTEEGRQRAAAVQVYAMTYALANDTDVPTALLFSQYTAGISPCRNATGDLADNYAKFLRFLG